MPMYGNKRMEKLKVEIPKPPDKLNYREPYRQIAVAMNVHEVFELGDPIYREKCGDRFKDRHGEIRAASLDVAIESRVARTLTVRSMTEEQLGRVHKYEKSRGIFIYTDQMTSLLKAKITPTLMTEERKQIVMAFNQENRPLMRKVYGVTVPPYFPPDNEFDGMEYHHAWDKSVKIGFLDLPAISSRKSSRKLLEESEAI